MSASDTFATWDIGRIYEVRGGPDQLRWFWSFALHGPMTRSDRAATLEEAKAQFQASWDAWKAWAKLEEAEIAANDGLRRLHSRQRDRHELRGTCRCFLSCPCSRF